jgi:hypothetical protein
VRREEKLGAGRGQRGIVCDGRAIDRKACAGNVSNAALSAGLLRYVRRRCIVQLRQRVEQRKDRLRTDYRQMLPKIPSPPLSRN